MRTPFESTGVVVHRLPNGTTLFGGTCFSFTNPAWYLTAAHVVRELSPDDLGIALYMARQIEGDRGVDVDRLFVHSEADLALIYSSVLGGFEVLDPF